MRLLRPGFIDKEELAEPHKRQAQARELFQDEDGELARRAPLSRCQRNHHRAQAIQVASRWQRHEDASTTRENVEKEVNREVQGEEYPQTLSPVQKVSVDLAGVKTRE